MFAAISRDHAGIVDAQLPIAPGLAVVQDLVSGVIKKLGTLSRRERCEPRTPQERAEGVCVTRLFRKDMMVSIKAVQGQNSECRDTYGKMSQPSWWDNSCTGMRYRSVRRRCTASITVSQPQGPVGHVQDRHGAFRNRQR